MDLFDPMHEYLAEIKAGRITAGHWITRIYEILAWGIDDGIYFYDGEKAAKAVNFMEKYCRHSEGLKSKKPLKLELWQKAAVAAIFGVINPGTGLRQFREIIIVIARKNGKSLLAAAICAYIAYIDSDYGGKIYFTAPKLDQADIVYEALYHIIEQEPLMARITRLGQYRIYIKKLNTTIRRIAFNSKKSDGFNPSAVVNDELAAWRGEQGIGQYEIMASATGAREQPLILSITTSNNVADGIYDEILRRSFAFLKGESDEKMLLPLLYIIDDIEKWDDEDELKKSNPNLGVSIPWDYLAESIVVAKASRTKKTEFMMKHCNIKQNASVAWLEYQEVHKCMGKKPLTLEDFRGCHCVAGVDLAKTYIAAVSLIIHKNGMDHIITKFFMPASRFEIAIDEDKVPYGLYRDQGHLIISGENQIDYKDIYNLFMVALKNYKIIPLKIGYDRYSSGYLVADLKAAGFHTDDVYQGTNLTAVMHQFEGDLKDGRYDLGDNNLLASHLLNVAIDVNLNDSRMKPVKVDKRSYIDGAVSIFDALAVRSKYHSEIGKKLLNVGK